LKSALITLLLLFSQAIYSQNRQDPKAQSIPDFDARDVSEAGGSTTAQRTQARAILDRRQANVKAFVTAADAQAAGTRIVANRHGIPKLFVRDGQPLSAPSAQDPEVIARDFLRTHAGLFAFTPAEIDGLRLIRKDVTRDATFVSFNQTLNGIDVFEGQIKFTLSAAGEVVQAGTGDVMPDLPPATAVRLTAQEAVLAALRSIGSGGPSVLGALPSDNSRAAFTNPLGAGYNPITVELSVFLLDSTSPRTAYRIFLEADGDHSYEILIDAEDGHLLYHHNLYVFAGQARVWPQSPMQGTRSLVTFPAGWLPDSATVTTGNNADAYVDSNGDDRPDNPLITGMLNGRASSTSQVFDFPFGDGIAGLDPRSYKPAAVTNLFYLLNIAHDYYYDLGFTEAAGNFQTDNFNRGGKGGDAVLGEAQYGGFVNNAAFSPTVEGVAPKIRMGLFTRSTTTLTDDLDSDFDGQVLMHEYGHGVSNRLVGAGTSTSCLSRIQSGALGEGWSDYFSDSFYSNPVQGAYLTQNTKVGFRRQSADGYTYTYEDIGNDGYEVHNDGEIWSGALWDLRSVLGQAVTDKLVLNGLKSTPCNPSMTDARDAILASDLAVNNGGNRAKLWQVFARHGLGYSAFGTDGTATTGVRYDAAYDQPSDLQTLMNPSITSSPSSVTASAGQTYSYSVTASNPNGGVLKYELTAGPKDMTVDSASGVLLWKAAFTAQRVKITVTDGKGGKIVHGFIIPIQTTLVAGTAIPIDGLQGSTGYASYTVSDDIPVLQFTLRGGTGETTLFVFDPDGKLSGISARLGPNQTLSITNPRRGRWRVEVDGFRAYTGVLLEAALITPTRISGNTTLNNLSGVIGSESFYRVTIPAGATAFSVSNSGASGGVLLILRKDRPAACPATQALSVECVYDYFPAIDRNGLQYENISHPTATDWYLDMSSYANFSNVKLITTLTEPPTLAADSPGTGMIFDAPEGGTPPAAQSLPVFEPSGAPFTWTAKATTLSGGDWLQFTPDKGSGDTTLKISVNQGSLKQGTYIGSVVFQSDGLAASPLSVQVKLNVTAKPVLSLNASALAFTAALGRDPAPQSLTIANGGGSALNWSVTATTASGGDWLQASVPGGTGNGTVQISVHAASLASGNYSGSVTVTASGADKSPATVAVSLVVGPLAPTVVNAASNLQGVVSPGELVVLFVSNDVGPPALAAAALDANGLVDTVTGETRVLFDGTPGAMIYAVAGQISAVVPYSVRGPTVKVQVEYQGVLTQAAMLNVAAGGPAIFTSNSSGTGQAVVINQDGTLNSAANPAPAGSVVIFYATGAGQTDPAGVDGKLTDVPLPIPVQNVIIGIGQKGGDVLYAGGAPGFVAGILQLNVRLPADAAVGDAIPLAMAVGTAFSPPGVTIAIK